MISFKAVNTKNRASKSYYSDFEKNGQQVHINYTTADDYSFKTANAYLLLQVNDTKYKTGQTTGEYSIEDVNSSLTPAIKEIKDLNLTDDGLKYIVDFFTKKHEYLLNKTKDKIHLSKLCELKKIE